MTTIVRYLRVPARHADAQFEHWSAPRGRGAGCAGQAAPDPARPLADRPGWQLAMRVLREGYADGVRTLRYEQVGSDLAEYEEVLNQLRGAAGSWGWLFLSAAGDAAACCGTGAVAAEGHAADGGGSR
ncbi:hypothetical protein [Streptomyces virginiae]|uniref:hypothetical protein n=1 Tax=Streptomyces virginiae TaxID=1961 RepID=UPI0033277C4F